MTDRELAGRLQVAAVALKVEALLYRRRTGHEVAHGKRAVELEALGKFVNQAAERLGGKDAS